MSLNEPLKTIIRSFTAVDRSALRKICADTAFMGEPVERFLASRELFADWATFFYTEYEPESIFLAEHNGKVIGYIMGCRDERRYYAIFWQKVIPRLLRRSLPFLWAGYGERVFLYNLLKSFLRGEFKRPDFSKSYPAHLHINIDNNFRGMGIGSLLMNRFLEYLSACHIHAVRLATMSKKAYHFFEASGFIRLYLKRVTYFDYLLNGPLDMRIYGKRL